MGHLISKEGVKPNLKKLDSMVNWPIRKNVKALREFLELTNYYRKFIRNYGIIAALLAALLKNDAFI